MADIYGVHIHGRVGAGPIIAVYSTQKAAEEHAERVSHHDPTYKRQAGVVTRWEVDVSDGAVTVTTFVRGVRSVALFA